MEVTQNSGIIFIGELKADDVKDLFGHFLTSALYQPILSYFHHLAT